MYAKKWKDFPEDDQGYAIYHRLLPKEDATNLDVALVRVKPGQTIPPHTHENEDQAYIVLEGKGILRLGGEEQELSEQMIVHIPPHTEHSVRNPDDTREFRYIYVASWF